VVSHFLGRTAVVATFLGWGSLGSCAEGDGNDCKERQQKLFHEKILKKVEGTEGESD
jgi:hypothetical protein